jgi:hypothetical protein
MFRYVNHIWKTRKLPIFILTPFCVSKHRHYHDSGKETEGSNMRIAIIDGHTDIQGQVCKYIYMYEYMNIYVYIHVHIYRYTGTGM